MGRYYSGDINGKFMFGVQNSNAADRFGAQPEEPQFLHYQFDDSHIEAVEAELRALLNTLRGKRSTIARLVCGGYSEEQRIKAGITDSDLSDYADFILGMEIRRSLLKEGQCYFSAEL
jgi:hypothetical protein